MRLSIMQAVSSVLYKNLDETSKWLPPPTLSQNMTVHYGLLCHETQYYHCPNVGIEKNETLTNFSVAMATRYFQYGCIFLRHFE